VYEVCGRRYDKWWKGIIKTRVKALPSKVAVTIKPLQEDTHVTVAPTVEEETTSSQHSVPTNEPKEETLKPSPAEMLEMDQKAEALRKEISAQRKVLEGAEQLTSGIRIELRRMQSDLVRIELTRMGQIPNF
jgi:hypothetical protein